MENEMDNINVDILAVDWLAIKAEEKALTAKRHAIEEQIAAALEVKDEGSISHKLDGHKVTLTQPVSRKIDAIVWDKVAKKIPTHLHPVKTVISADSAGCRYLLANEPKLWAKIAPAFETKAGKIGVKVEAL
tara:strand:+ start:155 stop:550 length:396 start_codon:yes stop_codon:yes gene_type:complete